MTHQEIYKILNEDDKLKFENLFSYYEKTKFGKKNIISFENFIKLIFRY